MIKAFQFLVIGFLFNNVYANDTVVVSSNMFRIDHAKNLIVVNQDVENLNAVWPQLKNVIILDTIYNMVSPINTFQIGLGYQVVNQANKTQYKLYFTQLPIININTDSIIADEPRALGNFTIVESNQNEISSKIGLELRGGWSQDNSPKKSYRIEFWYDNVGDSTVNYSLLGMRLDDDWMLQAFYNEPLRIRSKTNNDLWRKIHTIYYSSSEPEAVNGIQMKYAELFLNGEYQGLYGVGELIDKKQLKLKKPNGKLQGELYKGFYWEGAVTFTSLDAINNDSLFWDGFEFKYPDEGIAIDWSNLYEFVRFVMREPDAAFYSEYKSRFNIDNVVDYYLFLNLIRATDNTGKNIYIAKYKSGEPYFYVPWDLDGTFGTIWTGEQENITTGLLSNGFYDRLWKDRSDGGFRQKLYYRWKNLRSTIITNSQLIEMFQTNYNYLIQNGIYSRESMAWPGYKFDPEQLNYMSTWLNNRMTYLDKKFGEVVFPLVNSEAKKEILSIFPNPASDYLYFNQQIHEKLYVEIYNTNGQLIKTCILNETENTISLSDVNDGLYFIQIKNNNLFEVIKIVVQK